MPLEALAAVGLASNIVQFIDFLCNLFAESQEIRNSATGLSDTRANLESVASHLKQLTAGLASASTLANSPLAHQLKDLASKISQVANDLIDAIAELKIDKSQGKRRSIIHLLQQKLGKGQKIEKMAGKLSRLQEQLNTHLLAMMRDQNSDVFKEIQALIDESKRMETNTTQALKALNDEILSHIRSLDTKSVLHGSKIEDLLKNIGRLHSVSERDMSELSTRMKQLSHALSKIQTETKSVFKDQKLLRSLHFKTIRMRESKIPEAHARTFEWIFSEDNQDSKFQEWLQSEGGVFWAMGKAGSGKSTLMKFLSNHSLTERALKKWAGSKNLVLAKYFFWNAGNDMQKSQEGLLRSLLFEILRKCPQMIPQTFTQLYEDVDICDGDMDIWNVPSLLELFHRLSEQTETTTKFCFFVDGLDEYEGSSSELIQALRALSKSSMVKLCVSSRPWSVFKDEYGRLTSHMLKLEDLTRNDIALYVQDVLESHERFDALREQDNWYQELVQQIVYKAKGVFLWVFLVLQSLLRGLTNSDRISDLQRRIELLPETLEEFFRHMLDSVEEVYRVETFKAFQYALHAPPSGPIPLMVFSYLDEEDADFALHSPCVPLSQTEIESREDEMRRRLDGRTRGLLEPSSRRDASDIPTVDFLHRTARDFLLTRGMLARLVEHVGVDFDPNESLCKAFLAQMKLGPLPRLRCPASDPLDTVLYYAHEIESKTGEPATTVVDQVEKVVSKPSSPWATTIRQDGCFLGHVVSNNLRLYVAQRLAASPHMSKKSSTPMLHISLHTATNGAFTSTQRYLNPEMVKLLLSKGAKPNESLSFASTIWTEFLAAMYKSYGLQRDRNALVETMALLISHGADLEIPVQIKALSGKSGLDSGSYLAASEAIRDQFPMDADWLLNKSPSRTSSFGGNLLAWPLFKSPFR